LPVNRWIISAYIITKWFDDYPNELREMILDYGKVIRFRKKCIEAGKKIGQDNWMDGTGDSKIVFRE
jgi:hypothetical protein